MARIAAGLLCLLALSACAWLPAPTGPVEPIAQWQGPNGAQSAPLQLLAENEEEWRSLWALADRPVPQPLAQGSVGVGVFLGERPTGGYGLLLRGQRLPGGELLVEWREKPPAEDAMVTQAVTRPWAIALFPTGDGKTLLRPGR